MLKCSNQETWRTRSKNFRKAPRLPKKEPWTGTYKDPSEPEKVTKLLFAYPKEYRMQRRKKKKKKPKQKNTHAQQTTTEHLLHCSLWFLHLHTAYTTRKHINIAKNTPHFLLSTTICPSVPHQASSNAHYVLLLPQQSAAAKTRTDLLVFPLWEPYSHL